MENTENLKKAVASVSDEELRSKIEAVAYALGIPPSAIGRKFSDMSAVRKVIMNMSESDLNNILSTVGGDKANAIVRDAGKK
jgi:hypothetical protein